MTTPDQATLTVEALAFPSAEGRTLRGHFSYVGHASRSVVCYVHGFGGTRSGEKATAFESAAHQRGWSFAAFDFHGHGESDGSMMGLRCDRLISNLETFRGQLEQRNTTHVGVVGSSMGGWATSWFAQRNSDFVSACVLVAPAFYFPHTLWWRLTPEQRADWKQDGRLSYSNEWLTEELGFELIESAEQFSPSHLFASWQTPTLLFHGMEDEVVPFTDTIHAVEKVLAAEVELRLLRSGDHRLTAHKDAIAEEACRFLSKYLNVQTDQ